jgi:hypothetical protein
LLIAVGSLILIDQKIVLYDFTTIQLKPLTDNFFSANLKIPAPSEQVAYKPPSDEQITTAKAAKKKKVATKPAPKPTAAITSR